ncbi:MAG: hypothetical protein Q9195_005147 [Heterodermia aff. obscurata]
MASSTSPYFDFLGLPRELRNMVYYSYLSLDLIAPYDARDRGELAHIALLSVNKQIRAEARPIFYRINHWVLSEVPIHPSPFKIVEPDLFEKLEVEFSCRDLPSLVSEYVEPALEDDVEEADSVNDDQDSSHEGSEAGEEDEEASTSEHDGENDDEETPGAGSDQSEDGIDGSN